MTNLTSIFDRPVSYGLTSYTEWKGVWDTRLKCRKPAVLAISEILASPAWAPRAGPYMSRTRVCITCLRLHKRPIGFKLSSNLSLANGSTIISVPSALRESKECVRAPAGSPISCRQSKNVTKSYLLPRKSVDFATSNVSLSDFSPSSCASQLMACDYQTR